jgi:hypothetical protein
MPIAVNCNFRDLMAGGLDRFDGSRYIPLAKC